MSRFAPLAPLARLIERRTGGLSLQEKIRLLPTTAAVDALP